MSSQHHRLDAGTIKLGTNGHALTNGAAPPLSTDCIQTVDTPLTLLQRLDAWWSAFQLKYLRKDRWFETGAHLVCVGKLPMFQFKPWGLWIGTFPTRETFERKALLIKLPNSPNIYAHQWAFVSYFARRFDGKRHWVLGKIVRAN